MVRREVGCEVTDEGIERLGTEELHRVMPLVRADERRVGDDFEGGGFEGFVQLADPLLLAVLEQTVEFVGCGGLV